MNWYNIYAVIHHIYLIADHIFLNICNIHYKYIVYWLELFYETIYTCWNTLMSDFLQYASSQYSYTIIKCQY